ncbi:MAG: hypothetical protein QOH90_922 [Actinomycetota bacterium]|nr:hypothetical protein [Actinomycetota bacterium]
MEHQHVMYTLSPLMAPSEASPRPAQRGTPIRPDGISSLPGRGMRALRTRFSR